MAKGKSPAQMTVRHYSPGTIDSPSRQLQLDLERTFAHLQIHEHERQRLYSFNRKHVQDDLDARELAQAVAHNTEIERALAQHEIVQKQAVAALEAHFREEKEKRRQREEEERRKKEEEARRKAEEQRRLKEEQANRAREAAAQRAAAEKARVEEAERTRKQQKEAAARKKEQDDAAARREAEEAEQQEQKQKQQDTQTIAEPSSAKPTTVPFPKAGETESPWSSDAEIRHKHYLDIHQKLKAFRKDFWASVKKDKPLKAVTGDMRRIMKTAVGQLTVHDKQANFTATQKVRDALLRALKEIQSPPVVLNDYLPPHLGLLDKNTTTIPSLLLYLISIFSKAVTSAFVNECATNTKGAEPIGTMVAQIFSLSELQFHRNVPSINSGVHYDAFGGTAPTPPMQPSSVSLISILICKFHATAPILFGISGNEKIAAGKLRLGWRLANQDGKKIFVNDQTHFDRLTGLGAGYAAIGLRNFAKTSKANPYPPTLFWESLACVVNADPAQIQISHLVLLKSLLEHSLDRILLFFGAPAVAALRQAVVELPQKLRPDVNQNPAAKSLMLLSESWRDEEKLDLTR